MSERIPEFPGERKERLEGFEFAARTIPSEDHPSRDEDAYIADRELGLAAVFDGMGGHAGGQLASQTAARVVHEYVSTWDVSDEDVDEMTPESLQAVMRDASGEIIRAGEKAFGKLDHGRPGTTASVVKLHEFADGRRVVYIAHIGDSRVYIFHAQTGEFEQVTEDHDILSDAAERSRLAEYYQRKLDDHEIARIRYLLDHADNEEDLPSGLERYLFRGRNQIARVLGSKNKSDESLDVESRQVSLEKGDIVVITSDGIHDNLKPDHIKGIVARAPNIEEAVQQLTYEAYQYAHEQTQNDRQSNASLQRAKKDDMTAVAIKAL